jgi:hypothetical protein
MKEATSTALKVASTISTKNIHPVKSERYMMMYPKGGAKLRSGQVVIRRKVL